MKAADITGRIKISIAADCGFCMGVRNVINLAIRSAGKYGSIYMLGNVVHNEVVVSELQAAGVKVVNSLDEISNQHAPVIFRAHGTPPEVFNRAKRLGLTVIDGTCPLVKEIHNTIRELEKEGRTLIIIGDHGHEEVEGIAAQVKNAKVVANQKEALKLGKMKRAGVVVQSTQSNGNVQEILSVLYEKVHDLRFVNTICHPTRRNQANIIDIARQNEVVVIVGSDSSANTKRLLEISRQINKKSYRVSGPDNLKPEWFENVESVGISAGASTPDFLIEAVREGIERITS